MDWLNDAMKSLKSQSYGQLAEHAIVVGSVVYFANKLRKLKLSQLMKMVPGGAALLDGEIEKETSKATAGLFPAALETNQQLVLPEQGLAAERVLSELGGYKKYDADGRGRAFAYVYDNDDQLIQQTVTKAANLYIHSNALSPLAFPSLRKLEVECVRMTLNLLYGDAKESCGTLTSGGTESLMCAIKTYRDRARDLWPDITEPECVLPTTAHPATIKACHLFNVKCVYVAVDQKTQTVTPDQIAAAITANTIVIVVSAPQYPHGIMDPIEAIAKLAMNHKPHAIPVHVDACVGGFLLPFVEQLGYSVPRWDFRTPGVTSISVDLHKFGFTHKGASVLGFINHHSYRKYQFFAYTEWPGGLFVSPSLLGTRSGSAIAAAWTTLVSLGKNGYMKLAKQTMEAAKKFQSGINKIKGLQVIGDPVMSVTAFHSVDPDLNIHIVADTMEKHYKWKLERQHKPNCLHLTVMPTHYHTVDAFLVDLDKSVTFARAHPELKSEGTAAMYGSAAKIPDGTVLESFLISFFGKVFHDAPTTAAAVASAAAGSGGAGSGSAAAGSASDSKSSK